MSRVFIYGGAALVVGVVFLLIMGKKKQDAVLHVANAKTSTVPTGSFFGGES